MALKVVRIEGDYLMSVIGYPYWREKLGEECLLASGIVKESGDLIYLLVTERGLKKFKKFWDEFYKYMYKHEEERNRDLHLSYFDSEAPKSPKEFFNTLRAKFNIPLDYKLEGGKVIVSVPPQRIEEFENIREAIEEHLSAEIEFREGVFVEDYPYDNVYTFYVLDSAKGDEEETLDLKKFYELPKDVGWKPDFYGGVRDKKYGNLIVFGYVADWKLPEEVRKKLKTIRSTGRKRKTLITA